MPEETPQLTELSRKQMTLEECLTIFRYGVRAKRFLIISFFFFFLQLYYAQKMNFGEKEIMWWLKKKKGDDVASWRFKDVYI